MGKNSGERKQRKRSGDYAVLEVVEYHRKIDRLDSERGERKRGFYIKWRKYYKHGNIGIVVVKRKI